MGEEGWGGGPKRREQQRRQNSVLFRTGIVVHKEPGAMLALVSERSSG